MKQSHQNSVLFCESDLYALMQPDARKLLALSDEVDFPALRGQFRGENLPEIYRRLSEIAGADLMPLCETEQQLRQKMRIPADSEVPLNHQQKRFLRENYAHLTTFTGAYEAERFLGLRAIQAMQLRDTSPGYAVLGAYLFSQAMWLAREVQQNGYARVNFLARDGYFVKAAFDRLNEVLRLPVETGYVRISRQAALPLQFPKAIDLLSLPLLIDMTAHTPDSLLTLLHPIASERAQTVLAAELPMNQRMDARTQWNFVRIFREKGYDAEKYQQYEKNAKAYLLPMFAGKCATFDVGYNLRSETVIQRLTGADVTAYITHIDSDLPDAPGRAVPDAVRHVAVCIVGGAGAVSAGKRRSDDWLRRAWRGTGAAVRRAGQCSKCGGRDAVRCGYGGYVWGAADGYALPPAGWLRGV